MVNVILVYAPPHTSPICLNITVADGAKVMDVIHESRLVELYPEIEGMAVGIFNTVVSLDTPIRSGDRIEIYRPLLSDPKEKRRQRARG